MANPNGVKKSIVKLSCSNGHNAYWITSYCNNGVTTQREQAVCLTCNEITHKTHKTIYMPVVGGNIEALYDGTPHVFDTEHITPPECDYQVNLR